MYALKMSGVSFVYEGAEGHALDDISVSIDEGEFVTVLGANGAGKTTLAMLSNGLIPHAIKGTLEGSVKVFGYDISKHTVAQLSTLVGMVFQEPESQLFCMSVEEEVAFGPENLAIPRDELFKRVEWALDLVGLKGLNERSPATLSGGQKQRLAIAAALAMRPKMLVLDEPAYALDPVGRIELYALLRSLTEKHGMAVLLMDRDSENILEFSDKVVLMNSGRILTVAPPSEILRDIRNFRAIRVPPPQIFEIASLLNSRLTGVDFSFTTLDEAEAELLSRVPSLPRRGDTR
ncbi:MAG: ATP-binding cassette domain-containing protein [Candidatus Thermoplasmatota archaeon]|nr:ATP-binding cassette domain-containing protein [Candidatus Thermoplasmatota archaeon]